MGSFGLRFKWRASLEKTPTKISKHHENSCNFNGRPSTDLRIKSIQFADPRQKGSFEAPAFHRFRSGLGSDDRNRIHRIRFRVPIRYSEPLLFGLFVWRHHGIGHGHSRGQCGHHSLESSKISSASGCWKETKTAKFCWDK